MPERKYEKYIVTELKSDLGSTSWHPEVSPAGKGKGGRILYLDSQVVPGAYYADTVWILPRAEGAPSTVLKSGGIKGGQGIDAHTHDYDEIIAFFGTDLDDPHELHAEIEFWLEDEQYMLTKSCMVFVPAGMQHCPLIVRKVDKPVFHFTTSPLKKYF